MKKKAKAVGNKERFTLNYTTRSLKRTKDRTWNALREIANVHETISDLDFLVRIFRDEWLKSSDNPTKSIADLRKELEGLPHDDDEEMASWDQQRIAKLFQGFTCESELKAKRAVPS